MNGKKQFIPHTVFIQKNTINRAFYGKDGMISVMEGSFFKRRRSVLFLIAAVLYMFPCTELCGLSTALLLSSGIILCSTIDLKKYKPSKTASFILSLCLLLFTAFLFAWLSQHILQLDLFALGRRKACLEMGIIFAASLIIWMITGNTKVSAGLTALLIFIISAADYYVYIFRGSEMAPNDFMSVNTALTVAYDYEYTWTAEIVFAAGILILFLAALSALPEMKLERNIRERLMPLPFLLVTSVLVANQSKGLTAEYFEQDGSEVNGYLVNFMLQVKGIFIEPPRNYSRKTVRKIADELETQETDESADTPDVIVIMDESFADMNYIGDGLKTNIEVTPFINSLQENTTKGYALSSVYGGGTPNSEYEVLTGNTMMYLPKGIMAYQQYIKHPTYSMVGVFQNMGYRTIAMHPFNSRGWMRTKVYPLLGFDEMYFEDDFPQEDLIRFFVSDREMFETVLEKYREGIQKEDHVFLFGVTMQNHGGYEFSAEENPDVVQRYEKTVTVEGNTEGQYDDAEQYLSLIHETDSAVQYLLEELKKTDRHVVVLFYGDHYPGLSEDFYDMVLGHDFSSLDEYQRKYTVPFFIWTNYDSKEETVELTSLNYLSDFLYEKAGIELPLYNRYLETVRERIPAMNANGYWSEDKGKFVRYKLASGEEAVLLRTYYMLEYNAVIDTEYTNRKLFPLPRISYDEGE